MCPGYDKRKVGFHISLNFLGTHLSYLMLVFGPVNSIVLPIQFTLFDKIMSQVFNIQWVVQKNLTGENTVEAMQHACEQNGIGFFAFDVVPFSDRLPEIPSGKRNIFYGSTTTMYLAYQNPAFREGVFFDEQHFSIQNYIGQWGAYMLNADADIVPAGQSGALKKDPETLVFVRPDADSKSFSGTVMPFGQLSTWLQTIAQSQDMSLDANTLIVIGQPYKIQSEWRLWIVGGKVVTASKYRENFQLKKEAGCPDEVRVFAEARCREYMPHDIFVMDIGLCGGELYIIECGCMNSAGFYAADIGAVVAEVTKWIIRRDFTSLNSIINE